MGRPLDGSLGCNGSPCDSALNQHGVSRGKKRKPNLRMTPQGSLRGQEVSPLDPFRTWRMCLFILLQTLRSPELGLRLPVSVPADIPQAMPSHRPPLLESPKRPCSTTWGVLQEGHLQTGSCPFCFPFTCWCTVGNVGVNLEVPSKESTSWTVYKGHSLLPCLSHQQGFEPPQEAQPQKEARCSGRGFKGCFRGLHPLIHGTDAFLTEARPKDGWLIFTWEPLVDIKIRWGFISPNFSGVQ